MNVKEKLTKARTGIVLDMPFFSTIALRLKMYEDSSCHTAWTDGKLLGYNPLFINSLTVEKTKGLIVHEVMHLACMHHLRRQNREQKLFNVACDYAINLLLKDSGISLPNDAILDYKYKGMSVEKIYKILSDQRKQEEADSESGNADKNEINTPQNNNDNHGGNGKNKNNIEKETPDWGEVRDACDEEGKPLKNGDLTKAEQDMKVIICQAAFEAKMQGILPGALSMFVDEIIKPKVNWIEELKRFVDQTSKNDYSWTPPNRRHIHSGLYLPSIKGEEIKYIVIAIDTSISVNDETVKQFISEMSFIVDVVNAQEVIVIYCDTDIRKIDTFQHGDDVTCVEVPGRGGTDFRPPFKYVEELGIDVACFIYLTDMQCYSFPKEPNYPVLWACYGGYVNKYITFGEIIYID